MSRENEIGIWKKENQRLIKERNELLRENEQLKKELQWFTQGKKATGRSRKR